LKAASSSIMSSIRRRRSYRIGRCDYWIKVKNRTHPTYTRVIDTF